MARYRGERHRAAGGARLLDPSPLSGGDPKSASWCFDGRWCAMKKGAHMRLGDFVGGAKIEDHGDLARREYGYVGSRWARGWLGLCLAVGR